MKQITDTVAVVRVPGRGARSDFHVIRCPDGAVADQLARHQRSHAGPVRLVAAWWFPDADASKRGAETAKDYPWFRAPSDDAVFRALDAGMADVGGVAWLPLIIEEENAALRARPRRARTPDEVAAYNDRQREAWTQLAVWVVLFCVVSIAAWAYTGG